MIQQINVFLVHFEVALTVASVTNHIEHYSSTVPQTIRLDGDYNPRHLSRDDLVALLKARTANAVHSVRTLRLGAHASAVQLLKVPNSTVGIAMHGGILI